MVSYPSVLLAAALVTGMISIAFAGRATSQATTRGRPWPSILVMLTTAAAAFALAWASSLAA